MAVKKTTKVNLTEFRQKPKKSRPGIEAKTKSSQNKQSKNYVKAYRGQGR